MVINCRKENTEIIQYSPAAKPQPLNPILLGSNSKQFTSATKVLGVCVDNKLSFEHHSRKMAKRMCNRWRMITKLTNRTNGFNHQVIVNFSKTTFLPDFLYGGHSVDDIKELSVNMLYETLNFRYEMLKRSIGAIYNVNQSIAEVITGLQPLWIWNKINSIEQYLKTIQQSGFLKTTSTWTT